MPVPTHDTKETYDRVLNALLNADIETLELLDEATLQSASGAFINKAILAWTAKSTPQELLNVFSSSENAPLITLLIKWSASRIASTTALLSGVIFPIVKYVALLCISAKSRPHPKYARATAAILPIFRLLLVPSADSVDRLKCGFEQLVTLEAARTGLLSSQALADLIRNLPYFVILAGSSLMSDDQRADLADINHSLANLPDFKRASFQHLELLKDVFLSPEWGKINDSRIEQDMIDMLRRIMSDGSTGECRWRMSVLIVRCSLTRRHFRVGRFRSLKCVAEDIFGSRNACRLQKPRSSSQGGF